MNKTLLILRHEFRRTVSRKFFLAMTLGVPLLAFLGIGVYQLVQGAPQAPAEQIEIGYVDQTGQFTGHTEQSNVRFVLYDSQQAATEALISNEIDQYFVIPSNYLETGSITRYLTKRELEPSGAVVTAIRDFLLSNMLSGEVPVQVIDRVQNPLILSSVTLNEQGQVAPEQGGISAFIVPYVFAFLLIFSIYFSSGYLLESLGDEKENRVMEILLSSVSPRQLLTGKVLGLGASGLLQILVWVGSIALILKIAPSVAGFLSGIQVSPSFYFLAIVYFILGYLFYAILMAGAGAVSPTARDAQQLTVIFTLIGISPLWFAFLIIRSPGHVVAQFLTLFPPTAPVSVMIRLSVAEIPPWQLGLSAALLLLSTLGLLFLTAKIFRTFLLMYGKRPAFREIIRSIRAA